MDPIKSVAHPKPVVSAGWDFLERWQRLVVGVAKGCASTVSDRLGFEIITSIEFSILRRQRLAT